MAAHDSIQERIKTLRDSQEVLCPIGDSATSVLGTALEAFKLPEAKEMVCQCSHCSGGTNSIAESPVRWVERARPNRKGRPEEIPVRIRRQGVIIPAKRKVLRIRDRRETHEKNHPTASPAVTRVMRTHTMSLWKACQVEGMQYLDLRPEESFTMSPCKREVQ